MHINGFLAESDDDIAGTQSISAHRLDGSPMWTHQVEQFADIPVVAGAIVESRVDISTGDTSLTMLAEPAE